MRKVLITVVLLSAIPSIAASQEGAPTLVVLDAASSEDMWSIVDKLSEDGYYTGIVFPPNFLFVDPGNKDPRDLAKRDGIEAVHFSETVNSDLYVDYENGETAVNAFNYVYFGNPTPESFPHIPALNDMMQVPDGVKGMVDSRTKAKSLPYGATSTDTSEYMMGRISAQIIFMESNGATDPNQENWTTAEKNNCINEITAGLNWWVVTYPRTDLTFVIHNTTAGTQYEPIIRNSATSMPNPPYNPYDSVFVSDCLTNLGYTGTTHWDQCYNFANYNRDTDTTDWTYLMFIADDTVDADDKFLDGYSAYAYIGGPYLVMTYGNGGWGNSNMEMICAHETCHIFWGLDEYPGSPYYAASGYLNVPNSNYGSGGVNCLMQDGTKMPIAYYTNHYNCTYTDQMIGWRDTDVDGMQDILDLEPETVLNVYSPDPTPNPQVTYTGNGYLNTYTNNNPHAWCNGNDIHIGRITAIHWNMDGGSYAPAIPDDGSYDTGFENYNFLTPVMTPLVPHTFTSYSSMAWHGPYGLIDTSPAVDQLTYDPGVGIEDTDLNLVYRHPGSVLISWDDPSGEFDAFNLYKQIVDGADIAEINSGYGDKINNEPINGEPPYQYIDNPIELGYTYEYTLEAISYGDISMSTSAMITPGNSVPILFELFQNAPNPANANTVITFALPESTELEMSLYDIRGRKVAVLAEGYFEPGYHEITVDVTVPEGIYLYAVSAGEFAAMKKMLVDR